MPHHPSCPDYQEIDSLIVECTVVAIRPWTRKPKASSVTSNIFGTDLNPSDGAISKHLEAAGYPVLTIDLVDRGYGVGNRDFFTSSHATAALSPTHLTG